MIRRYKTGENLATIGAGFGVTRERVRQVVKQSGAHMPWEYKCAVDGCLTSRTPMRYCHSHQRRLELYGDPLGSRPLLLHQHGTVSCYRDGGCRCDLCRTANADRRREYQHRVHPEMRRYQGRPKGQAKPP